MQRLAKLPFPLSLVSSRVVSYYLFFIHKPFSSGVVVVPITDQLVASSSQVYIEEFDNSAAALAETPPV